MIRLFTRRLRSHAQVLPRSRPDAHRSPRWPRMLRYGLLALLAAGLTAVAALWLIARLLLAPLPVLDYVVIHELCHLKEPHHAPPFWALVAQTCPDYRERRDWLRQHGHELRL